MRGRGASFFRVLILSLCAPRRGARGKKRGRATSCAEDESAPREPLSLVPCVRADVFSRAPTPAIESSAKRPPCLPPAPGSLSSPKSHWPLLPPAPPRPPPPKASRSPGPTGTAHTRLFACSRARPSPPFSCAERQHSRKGGRAFAVLAPALVCTTQSSGILPHSVFIPQPPLPASPPETSLRARAPPIFLVCVFFFPVSRAAASLPPPPPRRARRSPGYHPKTQPPASLALFFFFLLQSLHL